MGALKKQIASFREAAELSWGQGIAGGAVESVTAPDGSSLFEQD